MMGLDFSYNLAPIIGVSQTFLDFGFNLGVLNTKLTDFAKEQVWAPFMGRWYGRIKENMVWKNERSNRSFR